MLAFMTLKPKTCQAVISRTRPLAGRTKGLTGDGAAVGLCAFCERACICRRPPDPPPKNNKSRARSCELRARDPPFLDPRSSSARPGTTGAATAPLGDRSSGLPDRPCAAPSRRHAGSGFVAAVVPGHSGGSATALHRLPSRPLRASPPSILAARGRERQPTAGAHQPAPTGRRTGEPLHLVGDDPDQADGLAGVAGRR